MDYNCNQQKVLRTVTPSVRVDSEFAYSSIIAAEQTAACGKDHIIGSKPRHCPGLFRVLCGISVLCFRHGKFQDK